MDQRKINEATTNIATMILKFSQRLNCLNKRVRELQQVSKVAALKQEEQQKMLNRSSQLDNSISSIADECTSMLNRLSVVVDQPSFMSAIDDDNSEKTRMIRQAKLHKLMTVGF